MRCLVGSVREQQTLYRPGSLAPAAAPVVLEAFPRLEDGGAAHHASRALGHLCHDLHAGSAQRAQHGRAARAHPEQRGGCAAAGFRPCGQGGTLLQARGAESALGQVRAAWWGHRLTSTPHPCAHSSLTFPSASSMIQCRPVSCTVLSLRHGRAAHRGKQRALWEAWVWAWVRVGGGARSATDGVGRRAWCACKSRQ